jgi:hypothetical protein
VGCNDAECHRAPRFCSGGTCAVKMGYQEGSSWRAQVLRDKV